MIEKVVFRQKEKLFAQLRMNPLHLLDSIWRKKIFNKDKDSGVLLAAACALTESWISGQPLHCHVHCAVLYYSVLYHYHSVLNYCALNLSSLHCMFCTLYCIGYYHTMCWLVTVLSAFIFTVLRCMTLCDTLYDTLNYTKVKLYHSPAAQLFVAL